jgi:hypothetical protein
VHCYILNIRSLKFFNDVTLYKAEALMHAAIIRHIDTSIVYSDGWYIRLESNTL